MMKKIRFLILVAILVLGSLQLAQARLRDDDRIDIGGRTATLEVEAGVGENLRARFSLGNNLAPGESGTEEIVIKNTGTIDALVCAELEGTPDYMEVTLETNCGQTLAAGGTMTLDLDWAIPIEADLGTGGQEFEFPLRVTLEQP
jgi:hypothetical protein